ncbi:hypothetical protein BN1221_02856 [Brenneria goodwinii]|uniref:Uncharacterized protein n=1 Tax=Brenneria goodwinii TaxID=1109412 RepID=A0A0G4JWP9_9GAMM|nr:hypothetical protein BN1221_02856 [Brenneria goodwinii]
MLIVIVFGDIVNRFLGLFNVLILNNKKINVCYERSKIALR